MAKTKKSVVDKKKKEERKNAIALLNEPKEGWDENDQSHDPYIKRDSRGRPEAITKQVLQRLREAFRIGCTDLEACIYAGIAERTLYYYCEKNPDFLQEKQELKETSIIVSRATLFRSLSIDADNAKWLLVRKRKAEFAELKLNADLEDGVTADDLEQMQNGTYELVEPKIKDKK